MKKGEITIGHARAILSLESSKKQINLLKKIIKEKMSVRELESIIYKKAKPRIIKEEFRKKKKKKVVLELIFIR